MHKSTAGVSYRPYKIFLESQYGLSTALPIDKNVFLLVLICKAPSRLSMSHVSQRYVLYFDMHARMIMKHQKQVKRDREEGFEKIRERREKRKGWREERKSVKTKVKIYVHERQNDRGHWMDA